VRFTSRAALVKLPVSQTATKVRSRERCANDRGYDCLLIEDGTDSYFPEFKAMTLKALIAQGGIVGWTCKSDELLKVLDTLVQ
jgi:nicotinamidase-related amidase